MLAAGASRRRHDRLPVHVDDAVDTAHQESLHRAVVFGDDDRAVRPRLQRAHANRLGQVDHRQGLPAQVHYTADEGMALGHQCELGQLQHFLHLEHVDREQLATGQAKHQNFQAVLTHQLRALVYRVENASHWKAPRLKSKKVKSSTLYRRLHTHLDPCGKMLRRQLISPCHHALLRAFSANQGFGKSSPP